MSAQSSDADLAPSLALRTELRAEKGDRTKPSLRTGRSLEPLPNALSLHEARKLAFQRNWDLLAAHSNVDLALAQKIVSREFPNPTFSYASTKISVDHSPNATSKGNSLWTRNYDTTFAINQLFEVGGKRAARKQAAEHGVKSAEAALQDARRTLDLAVSQSYISVLLAETNVATLRQSAQSLRKQSTIAEARLKAGDISKSDRAQMEIAADQLDLSADSAANAANAARIGLQILLGAREPNGDWKPTDRLEDLALHLGSLAEDLPAAPKSDSTERSDIQAARETYLKSEQDLRLQQAMRIPDPTLSLQYEHNPPDGANTVGIGVSLPLPVWNFNKGNIQAAQATRDSAQLQIGKTQTVAASEVSTAKAALAEAKSRLSRYRDTVAVRSEEVVKTIRYAYQKGGASLVDLLQAERTDNDIRIAVAQATADTAAAAIQLARAKSAPLPE